MLNDARVAILGGAEHVSTNTENKFTHRFFSSIGVLRIKENNDKGKQLLTQLLSPTDRQSIRISGDYFAVS